MAISIPSLAQAQAQAHTQTHTHTRMRSYSVCHSSSSNISNLIVMSDVSCGCFELLTGANDALFV